jgi:IclR family transcriptional regulator, KDG regulon repressor
MYTVKSLTKALNVMDLFFANNNEMSLGDISKSLHLNESTVNHITSTLVAQGYLKQQKKKGKYSLGVRFLNFDVMRDEIKGSKGAISYLIDLSRLVNESVHLSFWNGSNVLFSRSFDFLNESSKNIPIDWSNMPLYCTAMGKLVLSSMSEKDLNKYFRTVQLEKLTSNTIVDIDQLKEILSVVRREGIAYEAEEFHTGLSGIAVGVRNRERDIMGAVFMLGPSTRLNNSVLKLIAHGIQMCALKISMELGYQP